MNRSDAPAKQPKPFGINGQRENILPTTPAGDNAASYESGFPPITMVLKSAGGLPPKGQDMNQILYELSALGRWASAGALNTFDPAFATAIAGYPKGAYVMGDDFKTVYRCTTNGNTSDPNSVTTGWAKVAQDIADILALGNAAKLNVGTTAGTVAAGNDARFGLMIGVGQSWVNVTSSRAAKTTYTNDTGKPILVLVSTYATKAAGANFIIDGVVVSLIGGSESAIVRPTSVIVPAGSTYRIDDDIGSTRVWSELR